MIKINKKLYGTSLVALAFSLSAINVNAQTCVPAPTCETLGFTMSSSDCEGRSTLKCPFDTTKLFCADDVASSTPTTPTTTTYKVGDTYSKNGIACGKVVSVTNGGKNGVVVSSSVVGGDTKSLVAQNCNAKSTCGLDWGISECRNINNNNAKIDFNNTWTTGGCAGDSYCIEMNASKCSTGFCQANF